MFIGSWRKHQRPLIILIFSGVIFTFVFWGMGDPGTFVQSLTGAGQQGPGVLGSVGGEPITGEEFNRALDRIRQQQAQFGGEFPTNQELWEQGAVWAAWDDIVNDKLFEVYAQRDGFTYQRPFLVEQLKNMPDFQLPDGSFDARAWNEWVASPRVDWPFWYEQQTRNLNRRLLAERILASARVNESGLRERFALENTELTLRYTALEPPISPTDEEIRAKYEEDPTQFYHPQEWEVSFVRVPLEPDVSQDLEAIESLAASGESFESLAEIYADQPLNAARSEIGWVELNENLPELRQPLLDLAVGETSEAIRSGTGYLLYKVLEERFEEVAPAADAETAADEENNDEAAETIRSVRVEQLVLRPQLDPETRERRTALAESMLARAQAGEDLEELAAAQGFEVESAGPFDNQAPDVEGVPQSDFFTFRGAFREPLVEGEYADLIRATQGLYIARVDEKPERRPRALEDVYDQVRERVVQERQASQEYREEVRELGIEVSEAVDSLDEIAEAFPDLSVHIDRTEPFTTGTFSYATGIRWNVHEVAAAAAELEPGEMGGPFRDFIGQSVYFVELIDKTPPGEEVWAEVWPERREQMLQNARMQAQNQQFEDYLLYLRERAVEELAVTRNDAMIFRHLGLDQQEMPAAPVAEPVAEVSK